MANKTNLTIGAIIVLLAAGYLGIDLQTGSQEQAHSAPQAEMQQPLEQSQQKPHQNPSADPQHELNPALSDSKDDTARIAEAFSQQQSDVQVRSAGTVKAVLRDDNEGSRHQKFILKLNNGQTVLVAHNIDLSPRIDHLQKGDTVEFYGEYEYSAQGGVIHWTHHDPNGRHVDGWLKHQGKIYQ